jgi:hypothetical protein
MNKGYLHGVPWGSRKSTLAVGTGRGIGLGHLHPLLLESSEEENQRYQLDDLDVIEMDWLTLPYNTQKVSVIQEKLSGCEELVKGPLGEG